MNKNSSTNSLQSLNLKIKRPIINDKNIYRPISLSESYVSHIEYDGLLLESPSRYNNLNELLIENENINQLGNIDQLGSVNQLGNVNQLENVNQLGSVNQLENVNQLGYVNQLELEPEQQLEDSNIRFIPHHDISETIINKLMLFFFHLLLISLFELIFFFGFVVKYENIAIVQLITQITDTSINSCNLLNPEDKSIVNYFLNNLLNSSQLLINADISSDSRSIFNKNLLALGITYFIILLSINLFLYLLNYFYLKKKINYKGIMIDNCIMIIFLGLYEYLFFSFIVFKYQTATSDELIYDVYGIVNGTC